ncbi:MAG TPA: sigma-54 dependent transcriptional regulator [Planctomycetota bacterium]|nr:sigma-54 dependent transcriptional regulator [Planctomycetota bacterium]
MKALIIDDEPGIREALRMTLKGGRIDAVLAEDGETGLAAVEARTDLGLVFLDIKMPGRDGLDILKEIRTLRPDLPVIMISGHGTIETAVGATKQGAYDFLEKPLDRDRVLLLARNALEQARVNRENRQLKEREAARILGNSAPIKELLAAIDRVAPTHARVLVTGENGTGKELVARRLHDLSPRANGPLVDVNCAAIPKDLLESELFGHEKGSFTGAHQQKKGKFELADGGTLFLDEVGDMDLAAQAKVLRVIEQSRVERVGGAKPIEVNVRIVAATNKNLLEEVKAGRFREDLYYRLNVVELRCPPLRERREDIPLLAAAFLAEAVKRNATAPRLFDDGAVQALAREDWPGNVRQLRNVVEQLAILAPKEMIAAEDVAAIVRSGAPAAAGPDDPYRGARTFEEFKDVAEKDFLVRRLEENGWNVKKTAELLGMQRSNLYKKLERYGIRKPER